MSNTPVLSVNDLKRITGMSGKMNKKIRWHDRDLYIKPMLTLMEFSGVVQNIIADCKTPEETVLPDFIDFAIRANVVSAYAYVDLPSDVDSLYYILYASDLFNTVYKYANSNQIDAIISTVKMYIE